MSGKWNGSARADGLPRWWPVTVRRIIARDPMCRCTGCRRCLTAARPPRLFDDGCLRPSAEVDHIVPGDDHRDVNLRGICRPCHALKSSGEGVTAKAELRRPTGFLSEPHPGTV